MPIFVYIIGFILIMLLPDIILIYLAKKRNNKKLFWCEISAISIVILSALICIPIQRYSISQLPLHIFGLIFFLNYIPKWLYLPFAILKWRKAGIIAAIIGILIILNGVFFTRKDIEVRRVEISSNLIPTSFDGYKIVQISDTHLGSLSPNENWTNNFPQLINAENADLVVHTGDLVNNYPEEALGWDSIFNSIQAKDGKYACMGNHDYSFYSKNLAIKKDSLQNIQEIRDAFDRLGFKLLDDTAIIIKKNNDSIALLGTENISKAKDKNLGNVQKAISYASSVPTKIMLSHDPYAFDEYIKDKTDILLTLSGHTHAMQMGIDFLGIKFSPAQFVHTYWDGTYTASNNKQYIHVNRGLGYNGMPFRIGMPPEITVITLKSNQATK